MTLIRVAAVKLFQSTHSLRSATFCSTYGLLLYDVSIHALLAECDCRLNHTIYSAVCFNPRTPCGVRLFVPPMDCSCMMFQSTHSLRSATAVLTTQYIVPSVSIHALLAECDFLFHLWIAPVRCFNPRTPCGVRLWRFLDLNCSTWFQSTHSLRSATSGNKPRNNKTIVSIHALLAECDLLHPAGGMGRAGFNPRTPCGVRHNKLIERKEYHEFQSTHSLRSATHRLLSLNHIESVSIHALLAECDPLYKTHQQ